VKSLEIAKITANGQITLPANVRRNLNLKDGGKVAFVEQDGTYTIINPLMMAIENAQKAFEGEAEKLGLTTDDDVVKLVKEVRTEMWEKQNADNA
jgi:AbrB family looped-hinge helix DNA binding protein